MEDNDAALLQRTEVIVKILRNTDVCLPAGLPMAGRIVRRANVLAFLRRYIDMVACCGADLSRPRIAFHWTAEENFQSIADSNLHVPDGINFKRKNGAAFGNGIYVAPRFRDFREDFSNGASVALMCLVITGRQQVRRPRSEARGVLQLPAEFDSIRGLLSNRACETWVLPEADLILPCFLVDELALQESCEVLRAVINLICEPAEVRTSALRGTDGSTSAPRDVHVMRRWYREQLQAGTTTYPIERGLVQESKLPNGLGQKDEQSADVETLNVKSQLQADPQRRRWRARATK